MTHNDQFIERLENYLDEYEGVTPLPDAVRHAIRAELPHTRQVGPLSGLTRFLSMTLQLPTSARYGLAAAAVLVAVVVGANIVGRGGSTGGPGGAPSETPSASPSPTATAAPSGPVSLVESTHEGNLPSGDYYLDLPAYPARIDFQVPAGWWYWHDSSSRADSTAQAVLVDSSDTGAANGSAWGLSFAVPEQVRVDPCGSSAGMMDPTVTASADAMAEAFSSWDAFPVDGVEDVKIDGYSGRRVEVTRDEDTACQAAVLFTTPSGYEFGPQFPSSEPVVNQFTFLDVEGSVVVVWTTDFPATTEFEVEGGASPDPDAHVEDQAALHDIFESIVITPR